MKISLKAAGNYCIYGIFMVLMLAGCGGSSTTPAVLTSIAITPDPVYIGTGTTLQLTATGNYSDGTTANLTSSVKWTSANPTTIASVGAAGLLTAISINPGDTTTVTAALNGIISPKVTVTLTLASSIASTDLITARYDHTATELLAASGVVVAGGFGTASKALKSAELYDLTNKTWSSLPDMNFARRDHTETLLANGKVLLLGGGGDPGVNDLDTAELYDPATKTWALPTTLSTLNETRSYHTATLLTNGKVLVVGGGLDNRNEIYDPAAAGGTKAAFAATDISPTGRYSQTATRLKDGSVLVVGGFDGAIALKSAELFDPTALINGTPIPNLSTGRYLHSATLLNDGRVLVAGGTDEKGQIFASAELYNPVSNTWSPAASMHTPRYGQTSTLMPGSNQVLVMGGVDSTGLSISSAELYDPATNTWTPTANLQFGRDVGTATLLTSGPNIGSVLVTGGIGATGILNSVELHN